MSQSKNLFMEIEQNDRQMQDEILTQELKESIQIEKKMNELYEKTKLYKQNYDRDNRKEQLQ